MHYDYLIVGAGLFGACFAHEMYGRGKRCLLIDKRDHIAGNIYTEESLSLIHIYFPSWISTWAVPSPRW